MWAGPASGLFLLACKLAGDVDGAECVSALRGAGPEVCQAQILFNSGNLPSGVSQPASQPAPAKRCPGAWVASAGPEGRLPCLAPCHQAMGPMSHVLRGWRIVSPAECCAWGGGSSARDNFTHLTSAGASGPSAHLVDLELGSVVGPRGRVEQIWREQGLDSESW